jgi:DNA-binding transcriptional ArsR family regulator
MKALSDPNRWEIVRQMADTDELPCAVLESTLALSKPTISYHTNILVKAGLITARKAGRNLFYSLNRAVIDELMNELWALVPQPRPVRQGRINHGSSSRWRRTSNGAEAADQKAARGEAPLLTW